MGMMDSTQMSKRILIASFYDIKTNVKKIACPDTLKVCHNLGFKIFK